MACARCEPFGDEVTLSSPATFRGFATRLRDAIRDGDLDEDSPRSNGLNPSDPPAFRDLDLCGVLPDVLQHRFRCTHCGGRYELLVETWHGSGGRWRPID